MNAWARRDAQRPAHHASAFTAGEPGPTLGIAVVLGFIVVVALARVFAFPHDADPNAARHPLTAFNAALTGLH